jgi:GH43 family beta-xylosidase
MNPNRTLHWRGTALVCRLSSILTFLLLVAGLRAELPRFTNPLVEQRADPWIHRHDDGYYYLTATVPEYDRIELRRARRLDDLRRALPKDIWHKHENGPMSHHIWAPELHRIDGRWYIYFAAGRADAIWNIRMYVLENSADNPIEGEWTEKGQIQTAWDTFSLDATTFVHRGVRYLVWAQKDPQIRGNTNLYIARMDTPWSILQPQVMLTQPEFEWEQIGYWVNEGPAVIIRNGRLFLTYSASATDANYCMGLLTANENADPLDPASWTKSPRPVFATWSVNGQYGPGHNSFTTTPDGATDLMVYHARNYGRIEGEALRDPNRHTRAQVLRWHPDGTPNFGVPVPDGPLPQP